MKRINYSEIGALIILQDYTQKQIITMSREGSKKEINKKNENENFSFGALCKNFMKKEYKLHKY
jgi:hypothetical protein